MVEEVQRTAQLGQKDIEDLHEKKNIKAKKHEYAEEIDVAERFLGVRTHFQE